MANAGALRKSEISPEREKRKPRPDVPGWGADLNRKKRPGYPREANHENILTQQGNTYDQVPRQRTTVEILVSTEHKMCPPIFATTCPPKGLSGIVRRRAFRYSEGKKAHWLLLMLADRIDVMESSIADLFRGKLPHPIRDRGLDAEMKYHGIKSRFGHDRADMRRYSQQLAFIGITLTAAAIFIRIKKHSSR